MVKPVRYTLLLDEGAVRNIERLQAAYGLKNKAEVYDLSTRVLTWLTEQQVAGFEVGRFNVEDEKFQPLLLPYDPTLAARAWKSQQVSNDA